MISTILTAAAAPALASALGRQTGTEWTCYEGGMGGVVVSSSLDAGVPVSIWLPPPQSAEEHSAAKRSDVIFGDRDCHLGATSVDGAVHRMVQFWRDEEDAYFYYATKTHAAMAAIRRAIAGPAT